MSTSTPLSVVADDGETNTDWWFIYKLPDNLPPKAGAPEGTPHTTGWEYLYFDADTKGPLARSSKTLEDASGALGATLAQLFDAPWDASGSLGWILYNDETPTGDKDSRFGHTKGTLLFDLESDTALWLLHSWPKYPNAESNALAAADYGQTFLCVQLDGVETARYIAEQLFHRNEPQTYQCQVPDRLPEGDIFRRLSTGVDVNDTDPPSDVVFFSRGRQLFRMLAKNRAWDRDFWIDHVGPHLMADIDVETWRRGTVPDTEDSDATHEVTDILWIDLEPLGVPYEWHYTKDHSKWGISEKDDWVCVADINRQTSQAKRGGGTICFRNRALWQSLSKLEKLVQ